MDTNSADDRKKEFQRALAKLLRTAHSDGVDVEVAWDIRHKEPKIPDWTVEITMITKP